MANEGSLVFSKIIIKAFPILIWIPNWRKFYDFCVFQYLNHNNGLLISPFWCLCPFFSYFWSRDVLSGGNQSETGLLAICKHGLGLFCRKAPWGTFGEHGSRDSCRMVHIAQRGTTHEPQTFDLFRWAQQVFLINKKKISFTKTENSFNIVF